MPSQFAHARRRCRTCGWQAVALLGRESFIVYKCRSCGTVFTYSRKQQLLRWMFNLTYYAIRLRRILSTPRRNMALFAICEVPEPALREEIIRLAGL
jgi:ribosomal protein L37AE/L43A